MHSVRAELDGLLSSVPNQVVVELEIPVVAKREQRGITHSGELASERDLRISDIRRIRRHAFEPSLSGKRIPRVGAALTSSHREKPEADFIQNMCTKSMGPTGRAVN